MSEKQCRFCGGELEPTSVGFVCGECGKKADCTAEENVKNFEAATEYSNAYEEIREKIVFIFVLILIGAIAITSINYGGSVISTISVKKILRNNGYIKEAYKVEKIIDLHEDTKGLPSDDKNKLVLLNNNGNYGYCVVNTENKNLTVPVFRYTPLNVVQQQIWRMDKETNIKCIELFKNYVEQHGVNCMETKTYAESYLQRITDFNIISVNVAQNIISNSTMRIFPDIKSNDEVVVLFAKNSAVPLYYTTESSTMVYNWQHIFDESVYKVWKASTDRQTQSIMAAMHGEPYRLKEVWAVVDSDFNEVGTYDSLDSVKKHLNVQ